MSDILVRGMEIPTSCWACACYHRKVDDGYYDYDVCQASGTVFNDGYSSATGNKTHIDPFKQRLGNCPLVPVPPHGRLIDEKEICDKIRPLIENPYCYNRLQVISETLGNCLQIVRDVPTIIPAEEAE